MAGSKSRLTFNWNDISSWNAVGWYVAVLVGVWGALIGVGEFRLAAWFLVFATLLFCGKWGHATRIHLSNRRTFLYSIGTILAVLFASGMIAWTSNKAEKSAEEQIKLRQLDLIPKLQAQVNQIPALQTEIDKLTSQNREANSIVAGKQDTIEGLTKVVIRQNQEIAASAHKDIVQTKTELSGQIEKTSTSLSTDIKQYRNDTNSAVSKIMRPPRSLGPKRALFIEQLKQHGPGDVAITIANGNRETLEFAGEIESAFEEAGWKFRKSQFLYHTMDVIGLRIYVKAPNAGLNPDQEAVVKAFSAANFQLVEEANQSMSAGGPVEVYVGLQ